MKIVPGQQPQWPIGMVSAWCVSSIWDIPLNKAQNIFVLDLDIKFYGWT